MMVDADPLCADREAVRVQRRTLAALEACTGLPTDTLQRIAGLPPSQRPAALAEAAQRRAPRSGRAA